MQSQLLTAPELLLEHHQRPARYADLHIGKLCYLQHKLGNLGAMSAKLIEAVDEEKEAFFRDRYIQQSLQNLIQLWQRPLVPVVPLSCQASLLYSSIAARRVQGTLFQEDGPTLSRSYKEEKEAVQLTIFACCFRDSKRRSWHKQGSLCRQPILPASCARCAPELSIS